MKNFIIKEHSGELLSKKSEKNAHFNIMVRYKKVYVSMFLHVNLDGKYKPVLLEWETGRTFKIERVICEKNCLPRHVGAILTKRYDVIIDGKEKSIFRETQTNKWFVEQPVYS